MRLVRWYPFQELVAMNNQPDRTINDPRSVSPQDSLDTWAPPVDIFERHDQLVLRAEIPGVQKEDMDVRVEDGVLILHGERKQENEIEEASTYRMERVYGAFTRSFTLPKTVDGTKVTASYKDGVLEVIVPKVEVAMPKRIEIKAA